MIKILKNPLLDKEFLTSLDEYYEKEVWAKIIALDINENPVEEITGLVSGDGSINVDGTSSIRRSCSVSMTTKEIEINNFYWGLYSKFKLMIGLTNKINTDYPDIIWFPQGIYIITSFSTSQSVNSYNISIQGKDKMCLLNGEVGGSLTAQIDFGKIEERDSSGKLTITDIPIKNIIMEGVHEYAKEPWHNIIINDLDDLGIELLDYKGSKPLYLFIDQKTGEVTNMTLDSEKKCYILNSNNTLTESTIGSFGEKYNKLTESYPGVAIDYNKIKLSQDDNRIYSVAKIEYGQTAGYKLTDIIYPGDLIANAGEAFTSVLDKIVKMLGNFEYFYDTDGRFIFQMKKTYLQKTWNNLITTDNNTIVDIESTPFGYEFKSNILTINFSNNPNLNALRNDFSIWGNRKTASGLEIPIHLRYAIDKKPNYYKAYDGKIYSSDKTDWREIIYQMAKDYRKHNHDDDFLINIRDNNKIDGEYLYPSGYTGYEQYYIDIEGFWRQLYNPDFKINNPNLDFDGPVEKLIQVNDNGHFDECLDKEVYVYPYFALDETNKDEYTPEDTYVIKLEDEKYDVKPFIHKDFCPIDESLTYYRFFNESQPTEITIDSAKKAILSTLYVIGNENNLVRFVDIKYKNFICDDNQKLCAKSNVSEAVVNITDSFIQGIYIKKDGEKIIKFNPYTYTKTFREDNTYYFNKNKIDYYHTIYNYFENGEYIYWNRNILEAPELLNFWFDFMDTEGEMNKYSVSAIGNRPKVINDSTVKSIYFRETPAVVFINKNNIQGWNYFERKSGYTYIQLPESMLTLFNISSQGKSAYSVLQESIYNDTYCLESVSMNTIPIYYLQPNTRIYIRNEDSKIDGEYIVSRFTIPFNYNGTMSISATKLADRIN